jgi:hypothetical protein
MKDGDEWCAKLLVENKAVGTYADCSPKSYRTFAQKETHAPKSANASYKCLYILCTTWNLLYSFTTSCAFEPNNSY